MGKLQSRVYDSGTVKVVELTGPITMGRGDVTVRDLIQGLLGEGNKRIVIDLGGVPNMDSSGLGELVAAYTSATNQEAEVKLARLTAKVRDIMTITRLASVFETFDLVPEAVESFG